MVLKKYNFKSVVSNIIPLSLQQEYKNRLLGLRLFFRRTSQENLLTCLVLFVFLLKCVKDYAFEFIKRPNHF